MDAGSYRIRAPSARRARRGHFRVGTTTVVLTPSTAVAATHTGGVASGPGPTIGSGAVSGVDAPGNAHTVTGPAPGTASSTTVSPAITSSLAFARVTGAVAGAIAIADGFAVSIVATSAQVLTACAPVPASTMPSVDGRSITR